VNSNKVQAREIYRSLHTYSHSIIKTLGLCIYTGHYIVRTRSFSFGEVHVEFIVIIVLAP